MSAASPLGLREQVGAAKQCGEGGLKANPRSRGRRRPRAPAGTTIAIGTEIHLVNRLAHEHPDKTIVSLDPLICPCSTMNRIDLPSPAAERDVAGSTGAVGGAARTPARR